MNTGHEPDALPAELRQQFLALEGRLRRLDTLLVSSGALAAPLLTLGLLWVSDRFWDTPVPLRVTLLAAGLLTSVCYVWKWLRRWVWLLPGLRELSRRVQKHHRRLGDRLLGAVELALNPKPPAGMSPSLCRAAIRQVAEQAAQFDFPAAADPRPARRHALALAVIAVTLLAVCLAVPAAGWNALQRWALPLAAIDRFTFVEIELAASPLIVPHGEPFEVPAQVRYRAFWQPAQARARYGQQPELRAQVSDGAVRMAVPGQTQPGQLVVRLGDAQAVIAVEPTHRPALRELRAAIQLPGYLKYPEQQETVRGGSLPLLEGSRASFRGEVNRPIESVRMRVDDTSFTALPVTGNAFETPMRDWAGITSISFTWRDAHALSNRAPWTLSLTTRKDQPPTMALPELPLDSTLLETDILAIKMSGQDDFGLKEVGVHWLLASALDPSGRTVERMFPFKSKSTQTKSQQETYLLSPSLLRIPPDTLIEVRGMAMDHFPGRAPVVTEPHRIFVIGLVRHAELVRQQLENLFAQLEEVTRREEGIAAKTRELGDLPEQKLAAEEAAKQAGEQAEQQRRNAQDLERLAQEGARTMREAMRNPTFNEETIRDWARALKGMQDVAKQEMKQAGEQLQSAQQQSGAQPRSQELSQALQSEQQALDKLQKLQQQVNKGLDQLQAQTLAQRLKKLGGQETQLGGRLQELVAETIGLRPSQLSEHHRRANTNISGDQEKARDEAKAVQDEMSRFFDRTQRENYGEVARAMKEANTSSELDRLGGLIASNITLQAMHDLGGWAQRFNEWAEKLEPKSGEQAGGQGESGNTPQDDLMKQLMALLRLRENENNLRQQTQLLEREKQELPKFEESARKLADTQKKLSEDLQRVQKENGVPQLEEPLGEAGKAMKEAEGVLRRPDTGELADKSQVKVLEVLTDLINLINEQSQQQSQSSQSAAAAAQEMEFLMQMAQQQPGQGQPMMAAAQPGANRNGGGTGQAGPGLTGDARGGGNETRTVTKGSGAGRPVPSEFRDALENFYKAVEKRE
jgi:hypothetical protein